MSVILKIRVSGIGGMVLRRGWNAPIITIGIVFRQNEDEKLQKQLASA